MAPRWGSAFIRSASTPGGPPSTMAVIDVPCSARKAVRVASLGSCSAVYFVPTVLASDGSIVPTRRTFIPGLRSLGLQILDSAIPAPSAIVGPQRRHVVIADAH